MDQCFLAGMLHDVGRLVLATGLPQEYDGVWTAAREKQLPLWQVEQTEFGATHAEVGAYLIGLWGLPNPIVEAVAFHHFPARCPVQTFSPLTAVHASNVFAHEKNHGLDSQSNQLDADYLARLGLTERVAEWKEVCCSADAELEPQAN